MNPTTMSLKQHGFPLETPQPASQMLLVVDRLGHHNLRQPPRKPPVVVSAPKRSIETWRGDLERIGVVDQVLHVEDGAHVATDPLAVLDADASIRFAWR